MTDSEQATMESQNSARRSSHDADSSHQAAGLEQQSDQSTFEIQHSMSCGQPMFENVDDDQSVSEVAQRIPNAQAIKPRS